MKCGHTPHPNCKEFMYFFTFICNVLLRNFSGVFMSRRGDKPKPVSLIQGCACKPWQSWDISTRTFQSPTRLDGTVRTVVSEGSLTPRRICWILGFHTSCTYLPEPKLCIPGSGVTPRRLRCTPNAAWVARWAWRV